MNGTSPAKICLFGDVQFMGAGRVGFILGTGNLASLLVIMKKIQRN